MTDRFITVPDSLELPAAVKVPVARLVGPTGAAATPADLAAATAEQGEKADASDVDQITLTGDLVLTLPVGRPAGQVYRAAITQDGTGGHTVTYGGNQVAVDLAAGASTLVEIWPSGDVVYPGATGGGAGLDAEAVQDIVGTMIAGAGGSYDDAAGTITLPSGGGSTSAQIGTLTLPGSPAPGESVLLLANSSTTFPGGIAWDNGGAPSVSSGRMLVRFVWSGSDWVGTYGLPIPDATTTTTTTTAGGPVGPYVWEREVASISTSPSMSTSVPLTLAGTSGRVLVAALSADKNAGTISVSGGWTIGAQYIGNSVSGAIAYRLATGTDDITWTLGTAQVAMTTVHEWSGFSGAPTLIHSAFAPDPVDDTNRSTITIDGGAASAQALAVVTAGQDTSPDTSQITNTTVSGGYTFRKKMRVSSGGVSLFFAEQEVDASDATVATFDFNVNTDQAYALSILLRG